jgi:hypothetical protein
MACLLSIGKVPVQIIFDLATQIESNMLYKFKSKVTGDLIMLEVDAKQILKIMGRDEQVKGIFLPDQIQAAIDALEKAVQVEDEDNVQDLKRVSLRQRSMPMLKMLKSCKEKSVEIVWGV